MNELDTPPDDAPGAAYRALPRQEPPPGIDAAVLAAARRSVETRPARKWAVPAAFAAMLVLAVGVTLRVAEEAPETQLTPEARPPGAPAIAAPIGSQAPVPAEAERIATPAEGSKTKVQTAPRPRGPVREERAQVEVLATPRTVEPKSETHAKARVPDSEVGGPSGDGSPMARRAPQRSAEARAPMASSSVAQEANRVAAEPKAPQAWLERIAELRVQGRDAEAEESYAEFRKRFPAYVVPPEVLQKIAPHR